MTLIVIPRADTQEDRAEAQGKFQAAVDDLVTVVLVVYGDAQGTDEILEVCLARASVRPQVRRVVWVKDAAVLSTKQRTDYMQRNRVVVAIGLNDKMVDSLTRAKAKVRLYVEEAFTKAEGTQ